MSGIFTLLKEIVRYFEIEKNVRNLNENIYLTVCPQNPQYNTEFDNKESFHDKFHSVLSDSYF